MKTSVKILEIALDVENLLEETGYDFSESLDQRFSEIRREVETLESINFVEFLTRLDDNELKQALRDAAIITDPLSQELIKKASIEETKKRSK